MRTTTYCLLLLGLAAGACQKEAAEPAEPEDTDPFVAGELLVGITEGVPITKAFRLADSLNFTIDHLNGFFYNSTLPKDSIGYVRNVLLRKPYLNKNGFSAGSIYSVYFNTDDAKIRITNSFFEMDAASQQDWVATMQQLQLVALPTTTANVRLKVPVGEEKYWRTELRTSTFVKWTELNSIVPVQLH
jgi:hypothetical protein